MTEHVRSSATAALLLSLILGPSSLRAQTAPAGSAKSAAVGQTVQAHAVFTVSESKRLIAKAVAAMPIVRKALEGGMVIVCKGTTNTYVAEELLGSKIPHGAFVTGNVTPAKGGQRMPKVDPMSEVVLVKGRHRPDLTLVEALKQLSPGDVVIKGGNALDYANKAVGILIGSADGGTTARIMPYITAGKAQLVIPIGLEKLVAGKVADLVNTIGQPTERLTQMPRMQILPGQIVTEIEALKLLANVDAFQATAGGVGGAEGAVWMVWRGAREDVEKARTLAASIQGEEAFLPR